MFTRAHWLQAHAGSLSCAALIATFALATSSCTTLSDYSVNPHEYPGVRLYQVFCSSCHGLTAHGDGPVQPLLRSGVPDLTRISERRGGTFPREEIREIIDGRTAFLAHGTARMPVWGFEFYDGTGTPAGARKRADETIDRLVEYLQSIQTPAK
jgi:mono/diheme cytochrome c family protein